MPDLQKYLPYIVGGVAAVAVYFVPEARPIACGAVLAAAASI